MSVSEIRNCFSEIFDRVGIKGERIVLRRNKKPLVAMIPVEDLELLEAIEDKLDADAIEKALREDEGKESVPWEKVKKELGLE
jgi:PHD/YefM family antitoxin component YafN of YafNO toxin-antitoxin module